MLAGSCAGQLSIMCISLASSRSHCMAGLGVAGTCWYVVHSMAAVLIVQRQLGFFPPGCRFVKVRLALRQRLLGPFEQDCGVYFC